MKKIGLLVLVMVMALGALGVGYAFWFQDITITSNVTMGTLSAEFEDVSAPGGPDAGGASLTASLSGTDLLTVTASHLYPGYTGTVNFNVKNTGTVPVKISPTSDSDSFFDGNLTVVVDPPDTVGIPTGTEVAGSVTITLDGPGTTGNEEASGSHTFTLTVMQNTPGAP